MEAEKMVCRRCHAVLDVGDRFCRQCGASATDAILLLDDGGAGVPRRPSSIAQRPGKRPTWPENVWLVLAMLFVVMGPFALPMLWQSRRFSLFWKVVLTVLVGLITLLIVGVLWYVCNEMLASLRQTFG